LFGHEIGAFSGATRQHKGLFERADNGTLFLDELATTSRRVQEKILRVIEYGEFMRLGGKDVLQVDVRLVAATNGDLPSLAAQNKFRSDLLDRLAFDVITLPPLRERREDIMILAEFFAMGMVKELQRSYFPGFSESAVYALQQYAWPGNVRELKNVVERAVYRSIDPDMVIEQIVFDPFESPYRPVALPVANSANAETQTENADVVTSHGDSKNKAAIGLLDFLNAQTDFKRYMEDIEKHLLQQAYVHSQYNQRQTAEFLGMTYHQLRGQLRKYDLL